MDDLVYLDMLAHKEFYAIGFIPLTRYESEIIGENHHGSILVILENDDPVGFLYATHNQAGVTHIQQIAIQEDARRVERGNALVQAVVRPRDYLLSCRCAADLESTAFWEALGFTEQGVVPPKSVYGRGKDKACLPTRRKRDIINYQCIVGGLWLPTPEDFERVL